VTVVVSVNINSKLCADILSVYTSELMHSYKLRAKHVLGLRSVDQAHTRAITIVQRFDSALRLNSSLRSQVVPTEASTTAASEPQPPVQPRQVNIQTPQRAGSIASGKTLSFPAECDRFSNSRRLIKTTSPLSDLASTSRRS
jgi:hypothetical protein